MTNKKDAERYETRYCAFIDILGFGQLIDEVSAGRTEWKTVQKILQTIHRAPSGIGSKLSSWKSDLRAQSISDAVAISTDATYYGLADILYIVDHLAIDLLQEGYFIRGGLVKGKLYHDDKAVFGEALVKAYRLESTIARFPRVMVTREVCLDGTKYSAEEQASGIFKGRFLQSNDGPMYVHVLDRVPKFIQTNEKEWLPKARKMRGRIQLRFEESVDNPHLRKSAVVRDIGIKHSPITSESLSLSREQDCRIMSIE